jgi:hypothetical protein
LCLENENARYFAFSPPFRSKIHYIGRLALVKIIIALKSLNVESSNIPKRFK